MKKIAEKFFSKRVSSNDPENIMKIANMIGPLIEESVRHVFNTHKMILLSQPITYIVPAVWGAKKDGCLTDAQKKIHESVNPVIEKIFNSLEIKDLNHDQEFALYYLIRGIMISKIIYMIEALRNRLHERTVEEKALKDTLMQHKPAGHA